MGKSRVFKSFSGNFWTVILMEFFERGAYYAMMSILSVYLVLTKTEGGMGLSIAQAGSILGTIPPLLYFLPIFAGSVADKFGYRNVLFFAFICMIGGYFLAGTSESYFTVFLSLILLATGAGFFKPVISGTIAKTTNSENSTVGFGIYYWSINLGAFLFPLLMVPFLKSISYSYIFFAGSAIATLLLFINLLLYKEPQGTKQNSRLSAIFTDMVKVLADWRFILMLVLYSAFWILYFQMFGTVLWYLKDYVNMDPVSDSVNRFLSIFVSNPNWKFDVEHITVINAGVIITLQLVISNIVKKFRPLPTMISGIALGTIGMGIFSISTSPWILISGTVIFTIGEMTTHPKFIAYIGTIAPSEKKALYMGYSFLYGVIGSSVGGFLGSALYQKYVVQMNNPSTLWLIFSGIGAFSMISLTLYNRFIAKRK